ncbi:ketopantoate reductase family protein [Afipia sp. GAS231]|uniref:ketopantoate reductase family protein n=1 Tax=Afipia sp. GAS231 TaxID=1882747 RepID=UPI00087C20F9|nr:2-dehydropantoate 2-reductase [Afipia sp. GAS231]SDN42791.1 ketopantoate reductase [Afipia sp. GAS231]
MRIAMIGAGGFGGYFGARLAQGGADVCFLARGSHLAAIRANGLVVEGGPEKVCVNPVRASDNPTDLGVADFVLLAVKLWDTETVLEQIKPMVGPDTTLISFQNGVLKDDALRNAYGPTRIMGGVGYVATTIDRPGVIRQTGPMQRLIFGEFDGRRSTRAEELLQACKNGGINAELSTNVVREIWEKYVFLVGLSGTTTAMRSAIGPIRENRQTRAFLLDVMREVVAVANAHGAKLQADYAERRLALADDVAPDMTSSMHHDLQRSRQLEIRWLSGGVVQLGSAVGVATPLNRAIADVLALYEGGAPATLETRALESAGAT